VPTDDLHPYYSAVSSYRALPQIFLDQVGHFFTHYKDLEKGKWAKVGRWGEAGEAAEIITRAIKQGAKA
jgi:inorganic pyrophosphatase